jgi:hypothetical protein
MHYLVIEHFRNGDPGPVYHRFRAHGRLMPEGLEYLSSWITEDLTRCYELVAARGVGASQPRGVPQLLGSRGCAARPGS